MAPVVLAPPTIPHNFTFCRVVGADNTLDYVRTDQNSKLVTALPGLGWIDASSVVQGTKAAPFRAVAAAAAAAAHADWGAAAIQPMLVMTELLALPSVDFVSQCADALASLGVLDKTYKHSEDF